MEFIGRILTRICSRQLNLKTLSKAMVGGHVKSKITDNESAKMATSKGVIQGYVGVASVDKKHHVQIPGVIVPS